jgi:chromosomal replication initiator protein
MSHQAESETSREKSTLFLRRLHESLAKNKLCNEVIAKAVIERLEIRQEGDLAVATIRDFIYEGFIRQPSVHAEMKALTREVWGAGVEFLIVSGTAANTPRKRARKPMAEAKAVVDPLFEPSSNHASPASAASYAKPEKSMTSANQESGTSRELPTDIEGAVPAGPALPVQASRAERLGATARSGSARSGGATTAHIVERALSAANGDADHTTRSAGKSNTPTAPREDKSSRVERRGARSGLPLNSLPPDAPTHTFAASPEPEMAVPPMVPREDVDMPAAAMGHLDADETPALPVVEENLATAGGKGKKSLLAALGNINKMSMPNPVTAVLDSTDYETRASDTPERALDPEFTFQTFVQGTNNEIASQACLNAARNPGNVSNPVFIYGSTGLGKTHLLHAVGNEIQRNRPEWHVRYVTSEDFVLDFMRAVRHNKHHEFRNKYRQVDVLLVDDIQFLERKDSTQLEFFHTFNELYQSKKQIVITSDQYPKTIPNIEERLKSRFLQGLIASIEPPTFEDRVGIIEVKASNFGLKLRRDHIEFIATHVKSNVREITGVLKTLLVNQSIKGEAPSLEAIQQLLRKDMRAQSSGVELLSIQKAVSAHFGIKFQDLMSSSRKENFVLPRHVAMYLARDMLPLTTTEIALAFGRKDHTTVLNAVRRISDLIEQDASTLATVKELRRKLEHAAH